MTEHTKASAKSKRTSSKAPAGQCFIGVDLGDRWSEVCVLDGAGNVTERRRIATKPTSFREHFERFAKARVAIETGTHSSWVNRVLSACGVEVVVANAREVRKIHQSNHKNDRCDAETLARLLRVDPHLLSPVEHRSAAMQNDLSILRARDTLVRSRVQCINSARGLVKTSGQRLPSCSSNTFARSVAEHVPAALQPALEPLLQAIATLTEQIRAYDRHIAILAKERYPQTATMSQIPGVGTLVSIAYLLTLGDPQRFAHSRDVGPYLGMTPRQYDSGSHRSQLPITKAGNPYLRRLLVGSAHYILGPFGPDCQLRRHGQRLMQRGGQNAKKRAIVATARKLAVLLHHLWSSADHYEPLYPNSADIAA